MVEIVSDTIKYDKLAKDFMLNVDKKDRWYRLKPYKNCFVGRDAVDYLVHSGRAGTRHEAVEIGRHLQTQRKLFTHVADGDRVFEDDYLFYRYTSSSANLGTTSPKSSLEFPEEPGPFRRDPLADPPEGPETLRRYIERSVSRRASLPKIPETLTSVEDNGLPNEKPKINEPFKTAVRPDDMRCLALVAHNHMKPAMKKFIEEHSEILQKFRLTGTNTTMTMSKTIFGENNPDIEYGPTFTSGPLGGDAQLAALMCYEDLGGLIFFVDPLSPHPH